MLLELAVNDGPRLRASLNGKGLLSAHLDVSIETDEGPAIFRVAPQPLFRCGSGAASFNCNQHVSRGTDGHYGTLEGCGTERGI